MNFSHSAPFQSPDGRATYVTMSNGQRRRVYVVGGQIQFHERPGKAEAKRLKRRRHAR